MYINPIVLGAGIIGSSVVYHLSKLGYTSIRWFEHTSMGWFSTSKSAGLILHGKNRTSTQYQMVSKTIQTIQSLETKLEEDLGFVQCGSNVHSSDCYIDPIVLLGAYTRASNYEYLHTRVNNLVMDNGGFNSRVNGVIADGKEYIGDVIDCTGSWLCELAIKNGIMKTKPYIPVRSHYFLVQYNQLQSPIPTPIYLMNGIYVRELNKGNYIVGIQEKRSHYVKHTADIMNIVKTDDWEDILIEQYETIRGIFPIMDRFCVVDYIAGYSNYTADGHYLIGKICDGFYCVGGDCGAGISSCGGIGEMVATQKFMECLNPLRFQNISEEDIIECALRIRSNKLSLS